MEFLLAGHGGLAGENASGRPGGGNARLIEAAAPAGWRSAGGSLECAVRCEYAHVPGEPDDTG